MRIAVAGGTGTVGRRVVELLRGAGHEPVVLSRAAGIDLTAGTGLAPALEGADAVIDVAGTGTLSTGASRRFFGAVTENLLAAERSAGVPHHVLLSIVGAAEVDRDYYAGKALQERIVTAAPGGWTLLRTTQFHEFAAQLAARGAVGPLRMIPAMRSRPLAAAEVAAELVALAEGAPRGAVPDLAGPREERMADLVRRYLAATGSGGRVIEFPFPGAWGRAMRDGSLLGGAGVRTGRQSFDEWLAAATAG
jgi:uncharacterized protein YbjT (DUF2867 family)